jgi:Na+/phosphate symporter
MPTPKEIDLSALEEKIDYLIDVVTNLKESLGQDHYENNQAIQELSTKLDHISDTIDGLTQQVSNIE